MNVWHYFPIGESGFHFFVEATTIQEADYFLTERKRLMRDVTLNGAAAKAGFDFYTALSVHKVLCPKDRIIGIPHHRREG